MFIQPSRHVQRCKSVMTIRLRVAGNGGTGPVTGEAQWVLASLGWRCWEEGGGHAWSVLCDLDVGTNIGFGIGCAGKYVSNFSNRYYFDRIKISVFYRIIGPVTPLLG